MTDNVVDSIYRTFKKAKNKWMTYAFWTTASQVQIGDSTLQELICPSTTGAIQIKGLTTSYPSVSDITDGHYTTGWMIDATAVNWGSECDNVDKIYADTTTYNSSVSSALSYSVTEDEKVKCTIIYTGGNYYIVTDSGDSTKIA